jgi:hypothetical protein
MASFDDIYVKGYLFNSKDPSTPESLGRGENKIRGSTYIQGPVQFGKDKIFHPDPVFPLTTPVPKPEGAVMIGLLDNTESPLPYICDPKIKYIPEWEVNPCGVTGIGAEKYQEELAHPYPLVVRAGVDVTDTGAYGDWITQNRACGAGSTDIIITRSEAAAIFIGDVDIYGYHRVKDRLSVVGKADFNDDIVIRQDVIVGSDVVAAGNITADGDVKSGCGAHVLSAKKNFDIPHPSKEGWRLTHTCVEGPEAAVYVRGRVTSKTEITLPSYWKDLVDIQSITVNLTPIGAHQDIIVKRIDDKKIYLQSKGGMPIDCFYFIMAERKDTEKLIPEYEGNIEDYPGDNSQRSIAGYHYDTKEEN